MFFFTCMSYKMIVRVKRNITRYNKNGNKYFNKHYLKNKIPKLRCACYKILNSPDTLNPTNNSYKYSLPKAHARAQSKRLKA